MNLNLITMLYKGLHSRNGIKKQLRLYGLTNDVEFTEPLASMPSNQAMRIVVNWLANNAKDGYEPCLHIYADGKIYEVHLKTIARTVYVKRAYDKLQSFSEKHGITGMST